MSRLGFIGTGEIAAPMIRHLIGKGHSAIVTERSARMSTALAKSHGVAVGPPQAVLDGSDVVFLCVRPHQVDAALQGLRFRADHQIVSVMAAAPREMLLAKCAPATDLVQTIPVGFVERGGCPLPAFGNADLLAELFAPENPVIALGSEAALNAHFGICAMLPGILDLMSTGAAWLGNQTGDDAGAALYTTQLIGGFLSDMEKGAGRLQAERDGLATDGTLSLQMTTALHDGGAHDTLTAALTAIGERLTNS